MCKTWKKFKVYNIEIRNPRDQIPWKFTVAAPDRAKAQQAGDNWVRDNVTEPGDHRVIVMRKNEGMSPATIYVVA